MPNALGAVRPGCDCHSRGRLGKSTYLYCSTQTQLSWVPVGWDGCKFLYLGCHEWHCVAAWLHVAPPHTHREDRCQEARGDSRARGRGGRDRGRPHPNTWGRSYTFIFKASITRKKQFWNQHTEFFSCHNVKGVKGLPKNYGTQKIQRTKKKNLTD